MKTYSVEVLVILQLTTVSSVTIGVATIPHLVPPYPYPSLPYLLLGDTALPVTGRQALPPPVEIRDNGLEIETLSTPVVCSREAVSGDRYLSTTLELSRMELSSTQATIDRGR